jgi:ubiquinone/menaquinone biosynthesis C-methylase UbiE
MTVQRDPEGTEARTLHQFVELAGQRVLEIGCGDGRLTWKYAKSARRVLGIDLEAQDLRLAHIDQPSDLQAKTFFLRADSLHLPFSKTCCETAILSWTL